VAVKIKLKRMGKIRAPFYRIVVADSRTKRDGRAIEEIGKYHPKEEPSLIEVDSERVQYWLGVGAQPTEPVLALLKVTGDWQKFRGQPGAEGTLRTAEAKPDKKSIFEAAAKEAMGEAKEGATTPRAKRADKAKKAAAEPAPAEPAPAEAAPAEAAPAEVAPAKPAPAKPAPAEPAPAEPAPAKPAPAEAAPAEAEAETETETPAAQAATAAPAESVPAPDAPETPGSSGAQADESA
jgi:small subunit ribosomal protein S16